MRKLGNGIKGAFTLGACFVAFGSPLILAWSAIYWLRYGLIMPELRLVDFVASPDSTSWEGLNSILQLIWQSSLVLTLPFFGLVIYWLGLPFATHVPNRQARK